MKLPHTLVILGLVGHLLACATPTVPTRTLMLGISAAPLASTPKSRPTLVVRSVRVPAYIDQRDIVYRSSASEIKNFAHVRWGERLSQSFTQIITQALSTDLSAYQVIALSTTGPAPAATLSITIESAEIWPKNTLKLRGSYVFSQNPPAKIQVGRFDTDTPVTDVSADATVIGLNTALQTASQKLATELAAF